MLVVPGLQAKKLIGKSCCSVSSQHPRKETSAEVNMNTRAVNFFEEPGEKNTDEVISALVKRVKEGGIEAVVVASISGRSAIRVAESLKRRGLHAKVVCVSGPPSWEKYPEYRFPLISERERTRLKAEQVEVVDRIEEPFGSITFRDWWERKTILVPRPESDLFWMALVCVGGHGFRTAIEVTFMAVEAGAVRLGQRVIGVAGTGRGLDSAVVLTARRLDDAVGRYPNKRLKVEEVLAMPKETTWRGYG